jgi:O-glycosyl hydrolase
MYVPFLSRQLKQVNLFQIDAIALHWYGTDPQAFIAYVQDFHNTFGKNLWITEFACQVCNTRNINSIN